MYLGTEKNFLSIIKFIIYSIFGLLQIIITFMMLTRFSDFAFYTNEILYILALILVLFIVVKNEKASIKISWITFIFVLPLVGIISYFLFGNFFISQTIRERIFKIENNQNYLLSKNEKSRERLNKDIIKSDLDLIYNTNGYPFYSNTKTEYFPLGEIMFKQMIDDIKSAEKFIFLEYFIFKNGKMFEKLHDALVERAEAGIEIIIIYDSLGSLPTLPRKLKALKNLNIKVIPFNPPSLLIYNFFNYRDHRKICIIDGNIAYTGGINIGDEYINQDSSLGHWKDTAVKLTGDAVFSFTIMFLRMYTMITDDVKNIEFYRPSTSYKYGEGYVAPYCDGPTNLQDSAEMIYKKLITSAKNYIYISTPYLDLDYAFIADLQLAARSGIDVRIITPFIPDKKFVQKMTRSFYQELLESGVRIYEYAPGFIHAKQFLSDDVKAIVGSINLDYRSLKWNYECAVYICNNDTVLEIKEDFLKTFDACVEVTTFEYTDDSFMKRISKSVLRLISPLM